MRRLQVSLAIAMSGFIAIIVGVLAIKLYVAVFTPYEQLVIIGAPILLGLFAFIGDAASEVDGDGAK